MNEQPGLVDQYLQLMQEVLINAIYQDRAMDPWSQPVFDASQARLRAGLAAAGPHDDRARAAAIIARMLRARLAGANPRGFRRNRHLARRRLHHDGRRAGGVRNATTAGSGGSIRSKGCRRRMKRQYPGDRGDQLHRFPQLAVSLEEVTENFRRVGLWSDQVRLVKGWFKDTVPAAPIEQIAVLRLDGDLYESTIQVLEGFIPGFHPAAFASSTITVRCRAAGRRSRTFGGTTE